MALPASTTTGYDCSSVSPLRKGRGVGSGLKVVTQPRLRPTEVPRRTIFMSLPHRGPILSSPSARGSLHGGHYLGDVHHARHTEASSGAGDYHSGMYHSEQTSPGLSMRGSVGPSPLIASSRVSRQPSPSRSPHRLAKRNSQTPKPKQPHAQYAPKGSKPRAPQLHTQGHPEPRP
jgi:hypothetical protein